MRKNIKSIDELIAIAETKEIKKIIIIDNTEYDYRKCNDGGCYAFYKKLIPVKGGRFRVEYDSSSSFSMCPHCGGFEPCICGKDGYAIINIKTALAYISEALQNKDFEIEVII